MRASRSATFSLLFASLLVSASASGETEQCGCLLELVRPGARPRATMLAAWERGPNGARRCLCLHDCVAQTQMWSLLLQCFAASSCASTATVLLRHHRNLLHCLLAVHETESDEIHHLPAGRTCFQDVRGVGVSPSCPDEHTQDGMLCFPECNEGYAPDATVCRQSCPPGYADAGEECR